MDDGNVDVISDVGASDVAPAVTYRRACPDGLWESPTLGILAHILSPGIIRTWVPCVSRNRLTARYTLPYTLSAPKTIFCPLATLVKAILRISARVFYSRTWQTEWMNPEKPKPGPTSAGLT